MVYILARQDNWANVNTWAGQKWINLDFVPPVQDIASFIEQFGNTVSVCYENLASGFVFQHNADRVFLVPAPQRPFLRCISTRKKAESGEVSLNSVHAFTSGDYWGAADLFAVGTVLGNLLLKESSCI